MPHYATFEHTYKATMACAPTHNAEAACLFVSWLHMVFTMKLQVIGCSLTHSQKVAPLAAEDDLVGYSIT
jgi:hypothetical protein